MSKRKTVCPHQNTEFEKHAPLLFSFSTLNTASVGYVDPFFLLFITCLWLAYPSEWTPWHRGSWSVVTMPSYIFEGSWTTIRLQVSTWFQTQGAPWRGTFKLTQIHVHPTLTVSPSVLQTLRDNYGNKFSRCHSDANAIRLPPWMVHRLRYCWKKP